MTPYCFGKALCKARIATLVLSAIAAASGQGAPVTLVWDANLERDIAGYRLYYGIAPHAYTERIDVGNAVTATVSNLPEGIVYFFAVTAYNTAGVESLFSNGVAYAAPAPTPSPVPTPTPIPSATPFIIVSPPSVYFTAVAGGSSPAPQSIQVTTSTGGGWTSFDTSPWFTAEPTSGPSGTSTVLTPQLDGLVEGTYSEQIKFSAVGLPDKEVVVKLTVAPAPTPGMIAHDDFDRTEGELGPNWTTDPSWGSGLSISGNKVVAATAGGSYWNANTFGDDQYSQIRLTGTVGSWSGVIVRGNLRPAPFYLVTVKPGGADLYSWSNGSLTRLAHDDTGWATGDVVRLEVRTMVETTAHLTIYQNGIELLSYDDADSFIASGQPGIGLRSGTGGMSLDDWEGGSVP
jgi:hypothetical protein